MSEIGHYFHHHYSNLIQLEFYNYQVQIQIQLVIRDSCILCEKIYKDLTDLKSKGLLFQLKIINLDKGEKIATKNGSIITPSIYINNNLWNVGEVELNKLVNKIHSLTFNTSL